MSSEMPVSANRRLCTHRIEKTVGDGSVVFAPCGKKMIGRGAERILFCEDGHRAGRSHMSVGIAEPYMMKSFGVDESEVAAAGILVKGLRLDELTPDVLRRKDAVHLS